MFIMGSSGAGKTTLLNALWDRITQSGKANLEGEVTINDDYFVTQKTFGKYGAYVMQDDVLFPTLTWEEVIRFSAKLKSNLNGEELSNKVDEVIDSLGLNKWRKTRIGGQTIKGLSGGERKRTSIAVELITDPQIIFLDEPTSGLDSFTAHKIVKLLVDQSRRGKTIIATIHQPSSNTFSLFDKLLLLMDGHMIYQGLAKDSVGYFTKLGYIIPTYANPSDYFLKKFFVPFNKSQEDIEQVNYLVNSYQNELLEGIALENKNLEGYKTIDNQILCGLRSHASPWTELKELIFRTIKNLVRNPNSIKIRVMQILVTGILINLIFWNLGTSTRDIQGKAGFWFFVGINQNITALFSVVLLFIVERPVFLREYANKAYGALPYFISKSMIEIPFQFIFPIIFASITYFGVGMTKDLERFLIFTLILVAVVVCSTSVGLLIGWMFDNASKATAGSMLVMMPYIIFGGYLVNLGSVYPWLRWISYLSPIRYSTEACLRNELEDNDKYGEEDQIYNKFDFNIGLTEWILILIGLAIIFRLIAFLALKVTAARVQ